MSPIWCIVHGLNYVLFQISGKMKPLGKTESPVVERTFQRRQCVTGARQSLIWGGLNLLLAAFMYMEL